MIHMTTKDSKIEKALSAEQKGSQLQELEQEETYLTSKMLEWLMPWLEKTDEESTLGFWQDTLPTTMMVKLLEVWLTEKSRLRVKEILQLYHPLDRAAMAYALVLYMMTGRKVSFKSAVARQHYKMLCQMLKEDMPELMFAGHVKYMMRRYGPKKVNSEK